MFLLFVEYILKCFWKENKHKCFTKLNIWLSVFIENFLWRPMNEKICCLSGICFDVYDDVCKLCHNSYLQLKILPERKMLKSVFTAADLRILYCTYVFSVFT